MNGDNSGVRDATPRRAEPLIRGVHLGRELDSYHLFASTTIRTVYRDVIILTSSLETRDFITMVQWRRNGGYLRQAAGQVGTYPPS